MRHARLRRGVYCADIVPDRFFPRSLFHYVVMREGSKDILAWGQERSENAALAEAEHQIRRLQETQVA